jgi:hypothetical protein
MASLKPAFAFTTFVLAACGIDDERNAAQPATAAVSAEGKAEEGKISVKAPGFDLALSLPKEMAGEAKVDRDSKVLYPGATISGIAIASGAGGNDGGDSEVEMRFSTADSPEVVAGWYRDPARAVGYRLDKAGKEGDGWVLHGTQKRDNHPFKVRLTPREGGGTEGRLTVRHRD